MTELLVNPTFWHWLILACIFLGFEILAPGAFFLWISLAAAASAIIAFIAPELSWQVQYILFAVFCVVSLVLWKRFARPQPESDQPQLNQRNQHYLGRTLVLSQEIKNGLGQVRVDDSQWQASGEDAPAGSRVKVVAIDGSTLVVELV